MQAGDDLIQNMDDDNNYWQDGAYDPYLPGTQSTRTNLALNRPVPKEDAPSLDAYDPYDDDDLTATKSSTLLAASRSIHRYSTNTRRTKIWISDPSEWTDA